MADQVIFGIAGSRKMSVPPLHKTGDSPFTTFCDATFLLAAIHAKGVLEIAQLPPVRLSIILERAAAAFDRLGQNLANDRHQARDAGCGDTPPRLAGRVDARAKQHFTDIDVAKTRDDSLIQKSVLDRGILAPPELGHQVILVEIIAQGGLRPPQCGNQLVTRDASVGHRSIAPPKRRASLNVTRAPPSMSITTWSCFSGAGWS